MLASATRGGASAPIGWTVLLREGELYGGPPFGTILDAQGAPLPPSRSRSTCPAPDFSAFFERSGQLWMLTHLECSPAALQRTRLERGADGLLRALESAPAPLTPPEGLNNLCAGDHTPWDTLLSGEEYESNAALLVDGRIPSQVPGKADGRPYADYGDYPGASTYAATKTPPSPYAWGWMVETGVGADGATTNQKRYALGRFSHELGVVMPDRRTVYLTDDNTHGVLFLFVADRADDLSAGTLYAARWRAAGEAHALGWVSLGHAAEAEIAAAIARGVRFDELYRRAAPEGGACPAGYTALRTPQSLDECLAPVPGAERLASRLESRRAAALAGASAEMNKSEGLALDPQRRVLHLAMTRVNAGMLAGDPPFAGADHVGVAANPCGVIWGLELGAEAKDEQGAPIDSAWVARAARPVIEGRPLEGGGCAESSVSEPDNLAWIPGDPESGQGGVLLIAEDTDRAPNRLWAWQDGALLPVFAAPIGPKGEPAEVSGLSWVPEAGGASWITLSVQRGDEPAIMGVLGPF